MSAFPLYSTIDLSPNFGIPETHDNSLSYYEVVTKLITLINSLGEKYNAITADVLKRELSATITANRKLSNTGDFTGKVHGRDMLLEFAKTESNRQALVYLGNQFLDGQTGFVIDGGFFAETGIKKNYDGGIF